MKQRCLMAVLALLIGTRTAVAATITLTAGGDLQAALNAAQPGDVIQLPPGVSYCGNFFLPVKTGTSEIVIMNAGVVPPVGDMRDQAVRVAFLTAAASFPVICTINTAPALQSDLGAHHYRFVGVDIRSAWSVRTGETYNIVSLGYDRNGNPAATVADIPHHITFDRVFLHGTATGNIRRGIMANANSFAFQNSYCSDIHVEGNGDTQCVGAVNAQGPFLIDNNYLEAAGENILFGGDFTPIQGLIPSDVTITRNHITKKLSWKTTDPSYAGIPWSVKTLMEMKNVQRLLVEGNIFENQWAAIFEFALVMRPGSQNGSNPWATIKDVMIRHNRFRNIAAGINIGALDDGGPSVRADGINISDNAMENLGFGGGSGMALQLLSGPTNVTGEHNTIFASSLGSSLVSLGNLPQGLNFVWRDNLAQHKTYGVFGSGVGTGTIALSTYYSSYMFSHNVLATDESDKPGLYPTGNFFPTLAAYTASFVNALAGDFHLVAGSPYKGAGTDGLDLGANVDLLPGGSGATPVPPLPPSTCTYTVSPNAMTFTKHGGSGSVGIATQVGCAWTLTSDAAWLTVVHVSGTGSATAAFSVKSNNGARSRAAQLRTAGQVVTVTEQGRN